MQKKKASKTPAAPAVDRAAPCSAFDRWTAGDGDEDVKRIAWDAGRAPLLAALCEIHQIATRHKRASTIKRYLLADLESIERRSSPNDQALAQPERNQTPTP